jgi:hypothetical protein
MGELSQGLRPDESGLAPGYLISRLRRSAELHVRVESI